MEMVVGERQKLTALARILHGSDDKSTSTTSGETFRHCHSTGNNAGVRKGAGTNCITITPRSAN